MVSESSKPSKKKNVTVGTAIGTTADAGEVAIKVTTKKKAPKARVASSDMQSLVFAMMDRLKDNTIKVNTPEGDRVIIKESYFNCAAMFPEVRAKNGNNFEIRVRLAVDKTGNSELRLKQFTMKVNGVLKAEPVIVRNFKVTFGGFIAAPKDTINTFSREIEVRYLLKQERS